MGQLGISCCRKSPGGNNPASWLHAIPAADTQELQMEERSCSEDVPGYDPKTRAGGLGRSPLVAEDPVPSPHQAQGCRGCLGALATGRSCPCIAVVVGSGVILRQLRNLGRWWQGGLDQQAGRSGVVGVSKAPFSLPPVHILTVPYFILHVSKQQNHY